MDISDLRKKLSDKNALIVHFSHHSNMREYGVFPKDLQEAIDHRNDWPLSCSVLWPSHNMDPVGSVGVIFEPVSIDNIISVSNADSGSMKLSDGNDGSLGYPLSPETFEASFIVEKGAYNEWRVIGAKVIGIFVRDPACILVKKLVNVPAPAGVAPTTEIGVVPILMNEVMMLASRNNISVYTMGPNGSKLLP